jgi:hypothetical protein
MLKAGRLGVMITDTGIGRHSSVNQGVKLPFTNNEGCQTSIDFLRFISVMRYRLINWP